MRTLVKSVGLSAAAALVAVTGLCATAPQASAASCKASHCNGKNPQTTGCYKDAKTVADALSGGHVIELRYSKKCKAVWVRGDHSMDVRIEAGYYGYYGEWLRQKYYKTKTQGYWFILDNPYWAWTPMISVHAYERFRMYDDADHYWPWKNKIDGCKQSHC